MARIKLSNNQNDVVTIENSDTLLPIGSSVVNIKDVTKQVDTISDLKLLDGSHKLVYVTGYHTKGDGAFGSHFFEWDATSTEADNGGTIIALTGVTIGRYKLKYDGSVNVKWFGAVGDGVTDDTIAMQSALTTNTNIDGLGLTYRYESNTAINAVCNVIKNLNIMSTTASVFINIQATSNILIESCSFDNNRGSYTETWDYFTIEANIDSIQPSVPSYISIKNNNNPNVSVTINNCKFTNMFNESCITINTVGDVYYSDLYFSNVANKTYHTYYSQQGVGNTYANNITVYSCGKLPSSFQYNKNGTITTVNYGDINMPMPQGSFCNIVTYGNYFASNIYVKNYASTGICFDRNGIAKGNNIVIENDDNKMLSNNPSGAIWDEFCDKLFIDNFSINITARGADVGDNSALEMAQSSKGQIKKFSNGEIICTPNNYNNIIRYSTNGNSECSFDNVNIKSIKTSGDIMFAYFQNATIKDKIYINSCKIDVHRLNIHPMQELKITNSYLNFAYNIIDNYDNAVPNISHSSDAITFINTIFELAPKFHWNTVNDCKFIGCTMKSGDLINDSNLVKYTIDSLYTKGRILIVNCYTLNITNSVIVRRIEIFTTCAFLNISNNTIGNDEQIYTLYNQSTNFINGTIVGNNILVQAGITGAGFVNTVTGQIDANNNKHQIAYTL